MGRRCVAEGCRRWALRGRVVCRVHVGTGLGIETRREAQRLGDEIKTLAQVTSDSERRQAAVRFRRRVERGEYAALFSGQMKKLLDDAGQEPRLNWEIGAVRLALARVMTEMDDPLKMATAVSRLSHASVRLLKANAELQPEGSALSDALEQVLMELHGEP